MPKTYVHLSLNRYINKVLWMPFEFFFGLHSNIPICCVLWFIGKKQSDWQERNRRRKSFRYPAPYYVTCRRCTERLEEVFCWGEWYKSRKTLHHCDDRLLCKLYQHWFESILIIKALFNGRKNIRAS